MNYTALSPSVRALKILEMRNSKNPLTKIIGVILKFLEKYFGATILLTAPPFLEELNISDLKIIDAAYKLKILNIISSIFKHPRYPDEPGFYYYSAPSSSRPLGSGADFLNDEKAIWKSLAEAAERHLWFYSDKYFKNYVKEPYKNIKNRALNIYSLAGFSDQQKKDYSILQFNENTIFSWMQVHSLVSKSQIFCPIQLISALYSGQNVKTLKNSAKDEPMLRWAITTGLATGQSLEGAISKGILELIERDAFMISYLNKLSPPIIDLEDLAGQDAEIKKIIKNFQRYNLEVYIIQLPSDFSVYINLALIIDKTGLGPALSCGLCAGFNPKEVLLGALSESLSVRYSLKTRFKQKIDLNNINREERLIYWGKIENLPKISFFLSGEKIKIDLKNNSADQWDKKKFCREKLQFLIKEFKNKNYDICYAELTTKEIKKIGWRCIYAIAPQLQPMHLDEAIPYFGGNRLKDLPLKLGYNYIKTPNQDPHPFP